MTPSFNMPIYLSLNGRCQFIHNVNLEQYEQCAVIELWFEYLGAIEICLEGEKWVTGIILCWNWLLRARWSVLWSINKSLGTNLSYHDTYIHVQYTYNEHCAIVKKRIKWLQWISMHFQYTGHWSDLFESIRKCCHSYVCTMMHYWHLT